MQNTKGNYVNHLNVLGLSVGEKVGLRVGCSVGEKVGYIREMGEKRNKQQKHESVIAREKTKC